MELVHFKEDKNAKASLFKHKYYASCAYARINIIYTKSVDSLGFANRKINQFS